MTAVFHPPVHQLYQAHQGWLRTWLGRRLGCAETARDLAQDTFVRVLLRPQAVAGLREPRAYLTTVARGLVVDHWRRRSLEQAYLETLASLPASDEPSPEEQLVVLQILDELDRLFEALAPRVREAFVLAQFGGLDYVQVAAKLNITERTVKRYMAQGFECCLLAMT
ncbi:sigma-70 family RNA polymerase sigma factor [Pigmentiphaga aceris]|uniref:Sigma-70 family RNA polymerase sigma factor n=1 Tax=Pigmentiphaga aceris TaxID=1940612 RepID=A0A5C0B3J7_9BURK|nr:sigma-70 family RNA polymerase sigma factor [Pigmentiphaga aceris]QEI07147.1 sigma-70 family RNA polymerase sigma factor [Pigmentiphaga aceris]